MTALGGPAFAEFYLTDCRNAAKIPDDVEDFAPWISEPLACAVNGIRGSGIQIGDGVCIIGCGYMGLLLIQAMPRNVGNLVALDIRDERLALARKFGADFALNPARADAVEEVRNLLGGEADVVIEASGARGTLELATDLARPGGKVAIFGRHVADEVVPTEKWHGKGLRLLNTAPAFSPDFNRDFRDAVRLLEKGVFDQKPLITHRFPNEDAEKAFKIASERRADYIKGVITF
ncbi:MAG: zinc-binding dehydrogenase [Thermoproteota archaeon]